MRVAVVGSGPAGVTCAKALIRRGLKVTIFDVGESLDPERRAFADRLSGEPPERWDRRAVDQLTINPTLATHKIPRKLVFGSDYLYARDRPGAPLIQADTAASPTFARGGYSVAWGGAILPIHDCDMTDWPIRRSDLAPAYARVLETLPLSAREDRLTEEFPIYKSDPVPLRLSEQARHLLGDLSKLAPRANGDRILFGESRLAVRAEDGEEGRGCFYCGICLSGCPVGAIYSCADDLARLERAGSVEYRPGNIVKSVAEREHDAEIRWFRPADDSYDTARFDRVFLAAGTISTTRIMLESMGLFDRPVQLRDSLKFVLPLLRLRGTRVTWPNINSLADVFVELKLPDLSPHWIHMQISTVNDLLLRRFGLLTDGQINRRGRALAPLLDRVMIAWCHLHSDHSASLSLSLSSNLTRGHHALRLSETANPLAGRVAAQVARRVTRLGLGFRSLFLPRFLAISPPGTTGHIGGSFPMRATPRSPLETDIWGRPSGWRRVHLVDASVLPAIPATTIALTIMANADRIANDVPLDI